MKINAMPPYNPVFQYSHPLKTAFDRGLMPEVKRGLLGHKLTTKNRSIEHIIPKCMGGTLSWDNVALSDRKANMLRGATPIEKLVTKEMWIDYLRQFINVKNKFVDGMYYIKEICKAQGFNLKDVIQ